MTCLFCGKAQLTIYWLPDSEPDVCHVACRCGSSGPWEDSAVTAIANYMHAASQRLIAELAEALRLAMKIVSDRAAGGHMLTTTEEASGVYGRCAKAILDANAAGRKATGGE